MRSIIVSQSDEEYYRAQVRGNEKEITVAKMATVISSNLSVIVEAINKLHNRKTLVFVPKCLCPHA